MLYRIVSYGQIGRDLQIVRMFIDTLCTIFEKRAGEYHTFPEKEWLLNL